MSQLSFTREICLQFRSAQTKFRYFRYSSHSAFLFSLFDEGSNLARPHFVFDGSNGEQNKGTEIAVQSCSRSRMEGRGMEEYSHRSGMVDALENCSADN